MVMVTRAARLGLAARLGPAARLGLAGGVPELAERHAGGSTGQDRVGLRGILGGQDAGLVFDDPQVDRVDPPGAQRGEGLRQPLGDLGGEVHLPGGGLLAQVQLEGQLIGGELPFHAGPARRANSAIAAITVHSSRDCCRRAAEMMPISWSSEQPARPEPSSPVTVCTTVARRGPGAIVSAAPPWQSRPGSGARRGG